MNVKTFFKENPGLARRFCIKRGFSESFLSLAINGKKLFSPKLCVALEEFTERKLSRKDLREDWDEIWPELKSK